MTQDSILELDKPELWALVEYLELDFDRSAKKGAILSILSHYLNEQHEEKGM